MERLCGVCSRPLAHDDCVLDVPLDVRSDKGLTVQVLQCPSLIGYIENAQTETSLSAIQERTRWACATHRDAVVARPENVFAHCARRLDRSRFNRDFGLI